MLNQILCCDWIQHCEPLFSSSSCFPCVLHILAGTVKREKMAKQVGVRHPDHAPRSLLPTIDDDFDVSDDYLRSVLLVRNAHSTL